MLCHAAAFCDIDASQEPVAPGRTVYQMTNSTAMAAEFAVDGNYSTVSCTATTYSNQWLAIDIDKPREVRAVNVTNDLNPTYRTLFTEFLQIWAERSIEINVITHQFEISVQGC